MKADAATRRKLAEIGRTLRTARLRAAFSQAVLAAQIGMARENYLRLEAGRVNATVETLLRAAKGLGLELSVAFVEPTAKREPTQRKVKKVAGKKVGVKHRARKRTSD